jgi:transglutaminase-like putative cysteine protease
MLIRAGYEISLQCESSTPMMALLGVHPSRARDLRTSARITSSHDAPLRTFADRFGNLCTRTTAPAGALTLSSDFLVEDPGRPDEVHPEAAETPVYRLPDQALEFLLPSRYCETDRMMPVAWSLFGGTRPGWSRVQEIVQYVHDHIAFDYQRASPTRSALDAYQDRVGVCRDFAHLAVTFCRCMNIPARYCTGYLGDIGVPRDPAPMDFSAWFEAYLGDRWYTFDARHNVPRIGRILMARGRDAADVALTTTFGPAILVGFHVFTEEVPLPSVPAYRATAE